MRIRILNKNRIATNNDYSDFKSYEVDEGAVITDTYNETLDSCTIKISNQLQPIECEPFDTVILEDDVLGTLFFDIDEPTEERVCVEPVIYNYTITLFSQTKELEGIILPNLSITQLKNETYKRDILYYLNQYLSVYGPKYRKDGVRYFEERWHFSDKVYEIFENVECPEMQWNMPTLREVFTDLMMVKDCIPVLRNFEIDCINLSETKNNVTSTQKQYSEYVTGFATFKLPKDSTDISVLRQSGRRFVEVGFETENVDDYILVTTTESLSNTLVYVNYTSNENCINYIRKSQSSQDYISEIQMNMVNVMQSEQDGVDNTVDISESVTLNADDDYLITSENICIKTKYPILRLKHLWFGFWARKHNVTSTGQIIDEKWVFVEQDLCHIKGLGAGDDYVSLVYEDKEYQIKPVFYKVSQSDVDLANVNDLSKYQNTTLHYTRYSNVITNLSEMNKFIAWFKESLIDTYLNTILYHSYPKIEGVVNFSNYDGDYNRIKNRFFIPLIRVEYETTANSVFRASKSSKPANKRIIIDNQTNSFVDAYNQGNLEYQKANRLGNKQLMINARYDRKEIIQNLMKIGDYYEEFGKKYIIYQVQYQVYKNHVECNAIASENYVLRDYFTGVKSKIRTWVNAKEEALERHDLVKWYLEFSSRRKLEIGFNLNLVPTYFLNMLTTKDKSPLNAAFLDTSIQETEYCHITESLFRVIGNSLVFTTGFKDNSIFYYSSDNKYIEINATESLRICAPYFTLKNDYKEIGGIPTDPVSYVDYNLEFGLLRYGFGRIDSPYIHGYSIERSRQSEFENIVRGQYLLNSNYHKMSYTNSAIRGMLAYRKDNREIPTISVQMEFCSDSDSIVFTKNFVTYQQAVRNFDLDEVNEKTYKIWKGTNLDIHNLSLDGCEETNLTLTVTNDVPATNSAKIVINDSNLGDYVYYVTDVNNNILFATRHTTLYLNILKDRDDNVYNELGIIVRKL